MTVNRINLVAWLAAVGAFAVAALAACGGATPQPNSVLSGVNSIVFLQRPPRNADMGDVFQYQSYVPGARLVKLSPPSADGNLTVLCCTQMGKDFANIDIGSYDISFDARQIVFSGKLSKDQPYGLFLLSLDSGKVKQLPTNPNRDYVDPIFLPGGKIMFNTNAVVEKGAKQFQDEYERRQTSQFGVMNADGSDQVLGARNLSHRLYPTLLSDGRVLFTQWDHLAEKNQGDLMIVNQDMSTAREGFGKENTGVTNCYLRATEIAPGRLVAIGTSRDRTLQSGTILEINLGIPYTDDNGLLRADKRMSEANGSYKILTPQVPLGRDPSAETIGRYHDAYPLDKNEYPNLLVSWSDGPVQSGALEAAGTTADFGVYLYDSKDHERRPIWNDPNYWDVLPRPLEARKAPPAIPPSGKNEFDKNAVLIGAMNIYDSSLHDFDPGSIYGVRVVEGFSSEEGIPEDFGLTEADGAAILGVAPVEDDNSFAALIPSYVPVHLQAIDKFGMALFTEPVWISGNAGESRFCGGCHEDRAKTTVIQPGVTHAILDGPVDLMSEVPRSQRLSYTYTIDKAVGIPWDKALQPIFDAKCVSCHNGVPGPANPSYTIVDKATGQTQTITFDLRGTAASYGFGTAMMSGYSASHLSLLGPQATKLQEAGLAVKGTMPIYVKPGDARDSILIQKLNPPQLYPTVDTSKRAFPGKPIHPVDVGGQELTPDQYYLLIAMADLGGQFYSRENAPGTNYKP